MKTPEQLSLPVNQSPKPHVLIVGAGISGLCLTKGLLLTGHRVTVIEKSPQIKALGAGIMLQYNAVCALEQLELWTAVHPHTLHLPGFLVCDSQGKALSSYLPEPTEAFAKTYSIHRGHLLEALYQSCSDAQFFFACQPQEILCEGEKVHTRLSNRQTIESDLVVGADGIHSFVRSHFMGPREPGIRSSQTICMRMVTENHQKLDRGFEFWAPAQRLGLVPLQGEKLYSYWVENLPQEGEQEMTILALKERFSGLSDPAESFFAHLESEAQVLQHELIELRRPQLSVHPRVALIGDAAHAMTPNLGQGAAQGIEDALCLAYLVHQGSEVQEAVSNYQRERKRRVKQVWAQSRKVGQLGQLSSPWLCKARNQMMRMMPESLAYRGVASLLQPGAEMAKRMSLVA